MIEEKLNLHKINSDFTLLIFYDLIVVIVKQMPKIKETYDELISNNYNIKTFAVCTELEKEIWISFIKEKKIADWLM